MPFLVYAVALAIAVGTLALSVNLATAPDIGPATPRIAANSAVRQIPIDKPSDVSRGDPHNQLTPIYPAAPGKDLPPPADGADVATDNGDTAKPTTAGTVQSASTTGSASAQNESDPPRTDVVAAAPNSCAIDACGSTYRSFRASDCTYQPFGGPRRTCDLGERSAAQNADAAPPASRNRNTVSRSRMRGQVDDLADDPADELDEVERVVRRLPLPDNDYGDRRIVIIERPGVRYTPEVIYEER